MRHRDEQRIIGLEVRINELEKIVRRLEQQRLNLANSEAAHPVWDDDSNKPQLEQAVPEFESSSSQPHDLGTRTQVDWETQFGKVWMPRIFIVVLLIGVIWGFLAAVQAGWINRPVRVALGYAGFAALLTYGERQARKQRNVFGQILLGGAVALASLTTFAASTLYSLISPPFAFGLDVAFVIIGVLLSLRHRSQTLAVISLIAAILVPFLVKSHHPAIVVFILYESLASLGFLLYGLMKRYIVLTVLALITLHLSFATLSALRDLRERSFVIPVMIQAVLMFVAAAYAGGRVSNRLVWALRYAAWASLGLGTLWVTGELTPDGLHAFLWLVTGVLLVVSIVLWKQKRSVLMLTVGPFWIYLSLAAWGVMRAEPFYFLFVLIVAIAVVVGEWLGEAAARIEGHVLFLVAGSILLAVYSPFLSHRVPALEHVTWAIYTLVTFVITYLFLRDDIAMVRWWWTWLGIFVLGLFLTHESQAMTVLHSVDTKHMVLSLVWIAYSIGAITYGVIAQNQSFRRFGIVFLFVTLSKLVLIDIPAVTMLIRAILFIAIGTVGVMVSRVFYRKKVQ
ncbi:DUF2339 domain-containing protein [Alicyclobacillus sp. SO9]|uniref:DUF2339 domain-containing protein n=1 Tax=Alicyclobacillus sp. SO9 TaxID=2665646 RepID=UPI0018E83317|nr:DUF2339 domain-containing protein [Alicyclobacillus sp. SO9]QQE77943.1 DUF2339 domain-containing protein [Alicyclobacillus sp. SO9]